MPAVNSKPENGTTQLTKKQKSALQQLRNLVFLNLFSWLMMIPARPEMVLRITNNNPVQTSQILGLMTAGAGLFEFLSTQVFGRVSDKIGRKPALLTCTGTCFLFRFLDYLLCDGGYASVVTANWLDRLFAGACFPALLTVASASIGDQIEGKLLVNEGAVTAIYAGLGIMLGPWVGAQVLGYTGNPKYTALTASLCSLATFAYIYFQCDETLDEDKRRDIDWKACNPFRFLQLFQGNEVMTLLSRTLFLQSIVNDMHDVRMVLLKTKVGLTPYQTGTYMLGNGLSYLCGGWVAKKTLDYLGMFGHTSLCHIVFVWTMYMWGGASKWYHVALALVGDTLANKKGIATDALLQTQCYEAGYGKGETNAMIRNMGNVCKILGPYTFTLMFGRFGQFSPFLVGSVAVGIAQMLMMSGNGKKAFTFQKKKKDTK